MSYLTHVMVVGARKEAIEKLNAWLQENDGRKQVLTEINFDNAGGSKFWCHDVWAACFNYVPSDFLDLLRDPETYGLGVLSVQVIIEDENFSEVIIFSSSGNTWNGFTQHAHSLYRSDYSDGVEYRTLPRSERITEDN